MGEERGDAINKENLKSNTSLNSERSHARDIGGLTRHYGPVRLSGAQLSIAASGGHASFLSARGCNSLRVSARSNSAWISAKMASACLRWA